MGKMSNEEFSDFLGQLLTSARITEQTRRESHELTDRDVMYNHVMHALQERGEMTAREVAVVLYDQHVIPHPTRALIHPRLTELVGMGKLEVVGKKYDAETKRNVAVYGVCYV